MSTILVIDDDDATRKSLKLALERENFQVIVAENGKEGFELARKNNPDLVICDLVMPGLDGFQTLELFKTDPSTATLRWVFLTGDPGYHPSTSETKLGMEDFIPKPFSFSKLLKVITAKLGDQ